MNIRLDSFNTYMQEYFGLFHLDCTDV